MCVVVLVAYDICRNQKLPFLSESSPREKSTWEGIRDAADRWFVEWTTSSLSLGSYLYNLISIYCRLSLVLVKSLPENNHGWCLLLRQNKGLITSVLLWTRVPICFQKVFFFFSYFRLLNYHFLERGSFTHPFPSSRWYQRETAP